MTLRTAVIGVGHLGRQHARIHANLAAEGLTQFTFVCDLDEKTARDAMRLAAQKLPIKTKFVTRADQEGGAI